jgi:hypothetical protein
MIHPPAGNLDALMVEASMSQAFITTFRCTYGDRTPSFPSFISSSRQMQRLQARGSSWHSKIPCIDERSSHLQPPGDGRNPTSD